MQHVAFWGAWLWHGGGLTVQRESRVTGVGRSFLPAEVTFVRNAFPCVADRLLDKNSRLFYGF